MLSFMYFQMCVMLSIVHCYWDRSTQTRSISMHSLYCKLACGGVRTKEMEADNKIGGDINKAEHETSGAKYV